MDPPTPRAILRGHKSQVHAATFIRHNSRLATGDADGFVVLWDLLTMRPAAVWQAHQKPVLAIQSWGNRIITHGRDNELTVWKLSEADETHLSRQPPLESSVTPPRNKPWVDFVMPVNSMNFCAFSCCSAVASEEVDTSNEIWFAVPNALQLEGVDLFHLPSQTRKHTVKSISNAGMVMATALGHDGGHLTLAAGYENGQATVARLSADGNTWHLVYNYTAHSQPVLSLKMSAGREFFITTSADAVIAKHPVPKPLLASEQPENSNVLPQAVTVPIRVVNTKHAGQQGLSVRSDDKILATGGWDSRGRVYSCKTLKEVAVLKWHEVGCYTTTFACLAPQQVKPISKTPVAETDSAAGDSRDTLSLVSNAPHQKTGLTSVREKRLAQVREGHWLAMGSKDGRVSLWDVF
ncbi:ASTRA-associated protein 1 [Ceratocystis platani]|uniref:ASTRA-associated protein 1 n=1 Tax=Ceratocystis fimbriata f. sp. platani TaxID=88771 RepID=A0A0F8B2L4_CERFI|nr:ASTRA-associated protein 1 [Ceratocystis platani]